MAKMSVHEAKQLLEKVEKRYGTATKGVEPFRLHILNVTRERVGACVKGGKVDDISAGIFKVVKHWYEEFKSNAYDANITNMGTALYLLSAGHPITDCNKRGRLHVEHALNVLSKKYAGLYS